MVTEVSNRRQTFRVGKKRCRVMNSVLSNDGRVQLSQINFIVELLS